MDAVEDYGKINRHYPYFFGAGAGAAGLGAAGAAGRGAAGVAVAGAAGRGAAVAPAATGAATSNRLITSVVRSRPASAQMIPASRALKRISSFFSWATC